MAVSLRRPKFVCNREIFDENTVISWIGLSVVAGSFQLNEWIFQQNSQMESRRRNRNENLWGKGKAKESGKQERALKWHAEIEPDWGEHGNMRLPGLTPKVEVRSSGYSGSRTWMRNWRGLIWLPNREIKKPFKWMRIKWKIVPEGSDDAIKPKLLSGKAFRSLSALEREIRSLTNMKPWLRELLARKRVCLFISSPLKLSVGIWQMQGTRKDKSWLGNGRRLKGWLGLNGRNLPRFVGLDLEKCSACKLNLPFQTACLLISSAQRPFAVCRPPGEGRCVHTCVPVTIPEDAARTVWHSACSLHFILSQGPL